MIVFTNLKKISAAYKADVDELAEKWELAGRQDYQFTDEVKAQRIQDRNADYANRLTAIADRAQREAEKEIEKLRNTLQKWVVTSDSADTLQGLQAALSAGVALTVQEAAMFAQNGGYLTGKLLEKATGGRFTAQSVTGYEDDLKELARHFKELRYYRGGMASAFTDGYFGNAAYAKSGSGLTAVVSSGVMAGQLDRFPEKVAEMETRWAVVQKQTQD